MTNIQVEELERRVHDDQRYWPNGPGAEDYAINAWEMGLKAQKVCDSRGSEGAYYTVYAIYEADSRVLGAEPIALVFEDYSRAAPDVWVMTP